ncbi:beta-1,3-galactosyltransferase 6-like [Diadema antillarum]|uniref:beta-1,3-galactosyltransferase 6-like n=1 Tax=Diadema antillarum TaxID=105358 RepID=UPI003A86D478
MSRNMRRFLWQLLLCIPLFSLSAMFILMMTCDDGQAGLKDCKQSPLSVERNHDSGGSDDQKVVKPLSAFVVVLVMSGPKLLAGRQALRETWLMLKTDEVLVRFVIGTDGLSAEQMQLLAHEQEKFKDLLFLPDLTDSFSALTQKLIDMFVWLDHNVDYSFVLKVDDDSFVRLDMVLAELQGKNREKFFWGFFDGRARVHRAGKYAETDWVLCDRYLPYAKGGGYVLSSDLVQFVSDNSRYLKKYKGEDVSLGSWLAAVEVNREHDTRFDTEYKSRGCSNSYLITHKQSPEDMRQKWLNYKRTGRLCAQEFQIRPSYRYDWQKPPTECCQREQGLP